MEKHLDVEIVIGNYKVWVYSIGRGTIMDLFRFYCSRISNSLIELGPCESHHLAGVCRLIAGDKVELFDGKGTLASATVVAADNRKATVQVEKMWVAPVPVCPRITIAASIAKGERYDWLIGKCTELGVDRICPVLFERTVKRPKNPALIERWRNLAIAAAKQSRRVFLPQIDSPVSLPEALQLLKNDYPKGQIFVGSLLAGCPSIVRQPFGSADIIAFVGPEGGLTENEHTLLYNHDAQFVRLAGTILRTETAAVAFAAILTAWRDADSEIKMPFY